MKRTTPKANGKPKSVGENFRPQAGDHGKTRPTTGKGKPASTPEPPTPCEDVEALKLRMAVLDWLLDIDGQLQWVAHWLGSNAKFIHAMGGRDASYDLSDGLSEAADKIIEAIREFAPCTLPDQFEELRGGAAWAAVGGKAGDE